jgi:hypothetical protein
MNMPYRGTWEPALSFFALFPVRITFAAAVLDSWFDFAEITLERGI